METEYAFLYLEINLLSLVLIGIILKKTNGLSKMMAQRNFVMSIVSEMVFFSSDTLFVMINTGLISFGALDNILKLVCKELYFFSTAAMCFFWFLYFEHLQEAPFVKEKKKVRIASSILWIMLVLLIINLFTGFLFYVEPDGSYHRGKFFILTYLFSYTYVVIACARTISRIRKSDDLINKNTLTLLALFPIGPGLAGILQFVFPRLPVACGVLAITTLILYLSWIDQLISLDPLTGLNNRKQLNHFYDQWIRSHNENERIYALLIDANKFKHINDTYGHIQGDKALKNIAEALRIGCRRMTKRADIARYGGDEFAVIFEAEDKNEAEKLKERIKNCLAEVNEKTKVPFELTVSIGIADSEGKHTLKELIDAADEQMYNEKRGR
ncbi:MAG: diguanylate cyclase [Lachnospiraceae bacterium]|nr:diguanylate cyclase [Lachnospiraceae bacterium]